LEQSSGRSATPLAVTVVIWTKTETVFDDDDDAQICKARPK